MGTIPSWRAILRDGVDGRRLQPDEIALVVEIAETTTVHDRGLKRMKNAQAGIAVYWVVDGARSVVHVYADPVAGDHAQISTVRFGKPLPVPGRDATIILR